jgi:hypothetical protein
LARSIFSFPNFYFIIVDLHVDDPSLGLIMRWKWFAAGVVKDAIPVQDLIHMGAKLRTRLLKREQFLVIGDKIASCTHLDQMRSSALKSSHLLRDSDLNLQDKMNYGAVERLCKPHINKLLSQYVAGITS